MALRTTDLDFQIEAILEKTEVWTLINGQGYIHWIDGALINSFRDIYYVSPGKALAFLKAHSYAYERR